MLVFDDGTSCILGEKNAETISTALSIKGQTVEYEVIEPGTGSNTSEYAWCNIICIY